MTHPAALTGRVSFCMLHLFETFVDLLVFEFEPLDVVELRLSPLPPHPPQDEPSSCGERVEQDDKLDESAEHQGFWTGTTPLFGMQIVAGGQTIT